MVLQRLSSPHLTGPEKTRHIMLLVALATLPGLTMLTYYFGWGNLINIIWASAIALSCEALVAKLRKRPIAFYLGDYSAIVTAILLGLALPSLAPWWLTLVATGFAILIVKHLYGGLGQNPFNPAMAGYALVLISFPVEMTSWLAPTSLVEEGQSPDFLSTLAHIFPFINFQNWEIATVDAVTMATPLDTFKHKGALLAEEIWRKSDVLAPSGWIAWQSVSFGYFIGGAYLIYRKVFTWHAPVAMLVSILIVSTLFWLNDPSNFATPELHLLGGATMLGAFFIVTDPVTSATSVKGKLYYGAGIGLLTYVIRTWGSYPDAIAFSVLLMNFAAPFIDYYTHPRTYGHDGSMK